jgi:hypothetical protein
MPKKRPRNSKGDKDRRPYKSSMLGTFDAKFNLGEVSERRGRDRKFNHSNPRRSYKSSPTQVKSVAKDMFGDDDRFIIM